MEKAKPARRAAPRAVVQKPAPASSPALVVTTRHPVPRDLWPASRAAAVPAVDVLQRRRFALAGVALALVAVGGGVILGVGGRTLREATS